MEVFCSCFSSTSLYAVDLYSPHLTKPLFRPDYNPLFTQGSGSYLVCSLCFSHSKLPSYFYGSNVTTDLNGATINQDHPCLPRWFKWWFFIKFYQVVWLTPLLFFYGQIIATISRNSKIPTVRCRITRRISPRWKWCRHSRDVIPFSPWKRPRLRQVHHNRYHAFCL